MSHSISKKPFSPEQIAAAIAAAPDDPSELPPSFWEEGFVSHSYDELREEVARRRRGKGRKQAKLAVSVRYDPDIVDAFRSTGDGWQSRMNNAMRDWLRTHSPMDA